MRKRLFVLLIALAVCGPASRIAAQNATDRLVQSTLEKQKRHPFWFRLRSIAFGNLPYVFNVKTSTVKYDADGNPKKLMKDGATEAYATGVFTPIEDVMFYTPIAFMGMPVDAKTTKEWEGKRDKTITDAKRRSPAEKARIQADIEKKRLERSQFWDEFMKAFQFQTLEKRIHNGRPTTIVSYAPMPGYRPGKVVDTKYLPKTRGQIWIDDNDEQIAHFEIEFTEDVSAGFGVIGKVYKGSRYRMELAKQIDNLWLPVLAETVLRMRTLVTRTNEKYTAEYSNYRKFSTNAEIRT